MWRKGAVIAMCLVAWNKIQHTKGAKKNHVPSDPMTQTDEK